MGSPTTIATAPTEALSVDLTTGALFAERYEVLGALGQGGMGAVYRVRDRELGEDIALKVLKPEVAAAEGALDRFRREVKLARRVTHLNVARTYDLGSHDGVRYLTMELIEGEPLSRRIRGGRVPLGEALRIVSEIARGLAAAHAVGVVHRDLKPDNVMLGERRVVITDFGIARLTESAHAPNPTVGVALGTPAYMAPEQVEGRDLDGRADVYALGLLLYELLTATLPFRGDTPWAVAAARLEDRRIDPRTTDPSIPENVAELVAAALARKREQRLDAAQFNARLDAIRGDVVEPVFVTPVRAVRAPVVRAVALAPALGPELTTALATGLAKVHGVQVFLGEGARGDLLVTGATRVAQARVRVGISLLDNTGAQLWAESFNGTTEDPFALEDAVVTAVADAIRARSASDTLDDATRTTLTRARELMRWFTHDRVRQAIDLLRESLKTSPNDPHLLSLLGAALVRTWRSGGGEDGALLAEAEEVTLRALALDPNNGETFYTIGILRATKGELRAAVRAFEEATMRAPRLAEPHAWLARLLWESGRAADAERRIEHAAKLDPTSVQTIGERVRIYGLTGRKSEAVALLDGMESQDGTIYLRTRLAFAHRDAVEAAKALALIEAYPKTVSDLTARYIVPVLRGLVSGAVPRAATSAFKERTGQWRGGLQLLTLEALLCADQTEDALTMLEATADQFLDIGWLDHCPLTAPIRDDARFGVARAMQAARAAELWS